MRFRPAADRGADSIAAFWQDWQRARADSGIPVIEVAKRANSNRTTIYDLGKPGKAKLFPGPDIVRSLLAAIELPDAQLERYDQLAQREQTPPTPNSPSWRSLWIAVSTAAVLAAAAGAGLTLLVRDPALPPAAATGSLGSGPVVLTVQNMIAEGADDLVEDTTPAYLSSRPEPRCARPEHNCKIAGTEMATDALLVATCQIPDGIEMVNYNLDGPFPENPNRIKSRRWYGIALPQTPQTGFLSEVYVRPRDRGQRGLPRCPS